jgi:hypothetical protein
MFLGSYLLARCARLLRKTPAAEAVAKEEPRSTQQIRNLRQFNNY